MLETAVSGAAAHAKAEALKRLKRDTKSGELRRVAEQLYASSAEAGLPENKGKHVCDALQEADLATVGDLVRYCSDGASDSDEDLEQHVSALALETLGLVERATLRQLVGEARALCHATARLHGRGQGDGVPQLGDMAPEPPRHHLWSTGAESDETAQATVLRRLEEEAAEEYDEAKSLKVSSR